MVAGLRRQCCLQGVQCRIQVVERVADIKAEIGGHLIVARAAGMQAAGGGADQLGKPRLDIHVDVLERRGKGEAACLDL